MNNNVYNILLLKKVIEGRNLILIVNYTLNINI